MDNNLSNEYIALAIDELSNSLGVKKSASFEDFHKPFGFGGDTKKCVEDIAKYLELPIKVNLSYVPKNYRPDSGERFESKHLVNYEKDGQDAGGVFAQVSIPNNLPIYGSTALNGFPINVMISENCKDNPKGFVVIIAHELCHIVLHSIWHPNKDNEFYTDLSAMLLGFSEIFGEGRKTTTETSVNVGGLWTTTNTATQSFGYLSDEQFAFAKRKVRGLLGKAEAKRCDLINQRDSHRLLLKNLSRDLRKIVIYLKWLDQNPKRKIATADVGEIVTMHYPNYLTDAEERLHIEEDALNKLNVASISVGHFKVKDLENLSLELNKLSSSFNRGLFEPIKTDIKLLEKYVSPWVRIKAWNELKKNDSAGKVSQRIGSKAAKHIKGY